MRRMREFAPIMSSPEHHEGIQNSNFPQTMGKYTIFFTLIVFDKALHQITDSNCLFHHRI